MRRMNMSNLINCFYGAKDRNAKYIAVAIRIADSEVPEIIINLRENFDSKLEYYKKAYNEDLILKNANINIEIIGFTYGWDLDDIEKDLKPILVG